MREISRFQISTKGSTGHKRRGEAQAIVPFLLALDPFISLDDVLFGEDPPDFIFESKHSQIGVELTDLVPRVFGPGGFLRRAEFKKWQSANETSEGRREFEWGQFTVKESLEAITKQFHTKVHKAKKWAARFPENWLLLRIASGSAFSILVPNRRKDVPGRSREVEEYAAKVISEICSRCQPLAPFDQVILFSGKALMALPSPSGNPYSFPVPRKEVLVRGVAASEDYLRWSSTVRSVSEPLKYSWTPDAL